MENEKSGAPIVKASGLAGKKLAAMAALGIIPKDKSNDSGPKFRYLSDETLTARVHETLLAQKVVFTAPEVLEFAERSAPTKAGGNMNFATVRVRLGIMDTESGETETGVIVGAGMDSGDKAIYKALTGARKYYFRLLFGISTGDDPDAGRPENDAPANSTGRTGKTKAPPGKPQIIVDMENALADMRAPQPAWAAIYRGIAPDVGGEQARVVSRIFDLAGAGVKWGDGTLEALADAGKA